jgi:pyruvate/2-oxoglutarate dehydrogenase complex dihydrolipoamide acyltransferase (E2) component
VVVEIASEETWKNDRKKKPALSGPMGVLEYFLYDPNTPACWPQPKRRLLGWRWNPVSQKMRRLASDRKGRIWSEQLDSWLVPDGGYLRLHDRHHHLRLTQAEAQTLRADAEAKRAEEERKRADADAEARRAYAKRAEEERARAAAEAKRAEEERRRAEAEAEAKQAEAKRAEEERRRAEAEAEARQAAVRRAEALAEKLRALGINPDEIV